MSTLKTPAPVLVHLALVTLAATVLASTSSNATSGAVVDGLRLLLVRGDRSSNLTGWELIRAQVVATEARLRHLSSTPPSKGAAVAVAELRTRVEMFSTVYSVELGIGSGKVPFRLMLDTCTGITWTQCNPCDPKYDQTEPLFDPKKSRSYGNMILGDPLCEAAQFRWVGGRCIFKESYPDGLEAFGVVARDEFTFFDGTGKSTVQALAFGCAHSSKRSSNPTDPAGVIGLDQSPLSFIQQLRARKTLSSGSFSYCLFQRGNAQFGYLRFGGGVGSVDSEAVASTRFMADVGGYYLDLASVRMTGHPGARSVDELTMIDSGTSFSSLSRRLFHMVEQATVEHFRRYFARERLPDSHGTGFDLCFKMPKRFDRSDLLPSMSFEFADGASLRVEGDNLFVVIGPKARRDGIAVACLAVVRSPADNRNVIGAYQQRNHRFTYDLDTNMLFYARENCSHDGRS